MVLLRAAAAVSEAELVAGLAFLVAVWGGVLARQAPGLPVSLRYGAIVGFVATALLVLLTLAPAPRRLPDVRATAVPLALSAATLLLVVLTLVDVLPRRAEWTAGLGGSWLGVAGLLLALHLTWLWAIRRRGDAWLRILGEA